MRSRSRDSRADPAAGRSDASFRGRLTGWPGRLLAVLALTVALAGFLAVRRGPAVDQPIAFNHSKHTGELGLDCEVCHPHVTSGAHAGLPDEGTCGICHRTPQGSSAEAARVTELLDSGAPIRFNKLFRMPDHVFYTHRRHVGIGALPCEECHGKIAETTRPPPRPLVKVTMESCMDCHRETEQTLNCNACHR